jgi:phosphoadenosine phosphosulfate reductase
MLFLADRIAESIEILRMYEPPDGYFLAFSGGKDSMVLYAMAQEAGVKFDAHYHITTADPPELIRFIRSEYPSVAMDRSAYTMWMLIKKKAFPPTRIQRYCCEFLKESGGEGRVVLVGVKKSDSTARRKALVYSCRKKGKVVVNPLLNWCDDEIWDYIKTRGMKYCELYDQGFKRLGCIGCPMAGPKKQREEFERWPKFRDAYLRAFGRMLIERRHIHPDKEYRIVWNTPEEVMSWWLREEKGK